MIIDIEESTGNPKGLSNTASFSVDLMEPLIIDELSDIYLDSCMTMNCVFGSTQDDMAFSVKIDQFNINTRSASTGDNQRINNALLIPNEFNHLDKHNEMHLHKGKKMNYVCSINPTKLGKLTGTVTNLAGGPMFSQSLHYIKLESGGVGKAVPVKSPITASGFVGEVAAQMQLDSTHLYFYQKSGTVPTTTSNQSYTFTDLSVSKNGLANTFIAGIPPKMILEFLICNRK